MKYPTLKKENPEFFELKLNQGLHSETCRTNDYENSLIECENLYYKDGKINNRRGLYPIASTLSGEYTSTGQYKMGLRFSNLDFPYNNKSHRVCYSVWGTDTTDDLHVYLLSESGELVNFGTIASTSTTSQYLFRVENVFFLKKQHITSPKLYAFLTRVNHTLSTPTRTCVIYEYNASNSTWTRLTDNDYYIPTVYINGRGNKYNDSTTVPDNFKEAPKSPEDINLLSGKFKAYFTADGHSNCFKLPFSNLRVATDVICNIYRDSENYTQWHIGAGETSAVATFNGQTISLYCDRASGLFYFKNLNVDFAVPQTGKTGGNDICFICTKETDNSFLKIMTCKDFVSHNSRLFLNNNIISGNEIFSCHQNNPLYFPESMTISPGDSSKNVKAIFTNHKNIFAFKEDGIFEIKHTPKKQSITFTTPIGVSDNFLFPDNITFSQISKTPFFPKDRTVSLINNDIVWLGSDNNVYCLKDNRTVTEISQKIKPLMDAHIQAEGIEIFAFTYNNNYVLNMGNKAYILNMDDDMPCWYYWEYPNYNRFTDAVCLKDNVFYSFLDASQTHTFISSLSGEVDGVLTASAGNTATVNDFAVNFTFKTHKFDFGKTKSPKRVKKIIADVSCTGSAEIGLETDFGRVTQHFSPVGSHIGEKTFRFIPIPTEKVGITLKGIAPLTVKNIKLKYLE